MRVSMIQISRQTSWLTSTQVKHSQSQCLYTFAAELKQCYDSVAKHQLHACIVCCMCINSMTAAVCVSLPHACRLTSCFPVLCGKLYWLNKYHLHLLAIPQLQNLQLPCCIRGVQVASASVSCHFSQNLTWRSDSSLVHEILGTRELSNVTFSSLNRRHCTQSASTHSHFHCLYNKNAVNANGLVARSSYRRLTAEQP